MISLSPPTICNSALNPGVANRFSALSICHASRWNVPVEIEEVRIW
uniref:Uncharacterized protein n=1 Tax=Escherichia coli TaxID=562 RepID=A0A345WWM3_ECOLX|nr:hypothetical protein [Escherichia coli]